MKHKNSELQRGLTEKRLLVQLFWRNECFLLFCPVILSQYSFMKVKRHWCVLFDLPSFMSFHNASIIYKYSLWKDSNSSFSVYNIAFVIESKKSSPTLNGFLISRNFPCFFCFVLLVFFVCWFFFLVSFPLIKTKILCAIYLHNATKCSFYIIDSVFSKSSRT